MNLLGTLSTLGSGVSTGFFLDDVSDSDDWKLLGTFIATSTTATLANSEYKDGSATVDLVDEYIESMSEKELAALDEKLSGKDFDLTFNDESPKVFCKNESKGI